MFGRHGGAGDNRLQLRGTRRPACATSGGRKFQSDFRSSRRTAVQQQRLERRIDGRLLHQDFNAAGDGLGHAMVLVRYVKHNRGCSSRPASHPAGRLRPPLSRADSDNLVGRLSSLRPVGHGCPWSCRSCPAVGLVGPRVSFRARSNSLTSAARACRHHADGCQHGDCGLAEEGAAVFFGHAGLGDDGFELHAGAAASIIASAGSSTSPISSAAAARRWRSNSLNSGSTAAFLTSTSMPRGMGPTLWPLPGGRPPTIVVRTASCSTGRSARNLGSGGAFRFSHGTALRKETGFCSSIDAPGRRKVSCPRRETRAFSIAAAVGRCK